MSFCQQPNQQGWIFQSICEIIPWALIFWLACWVNLAVAQSATQANGSDPIELGRRIYREGTLSSGEPLKGKSVGGMVIEGSQTACVNCHRPSGMGSTEGEMLIYPITGDYLYHPDKHQLATMDPRTGKRFNQAHPPYTDVTLARAIAKGIDVNGRVMNVVMPVYDLNQQDMQALIAYLKSLSSSWSPGVSNDLIRFATVIAPGVKAERRQAALAILQQAIAQKNANSATGSQRQGKRRHMVTAAERVLGTERKWELDVWELHGSPDTWVKQLDEKYLHKPVFALISGLADGTWEPVHEFCQRNAIPCWFPSVPLPPNKESFYDLYFSQGVALEAKVLAKYLTSTSQNKPKRLIQVHRDEYTGNEASKTLKDSVSKSGILVEDVVLQEGQFRKALSGLTKQDAMILWLERSELREIKSLTIPTNGAIFFSSILAGGEQGIPSNWKGVAKLVYPYELPDKREGNLSYFHSWMKQKNIALVDEPLQSEVFFAV
ncbi:MAG: c-type cytochrome, partial [Candidatus Methylumidiphilus sp.]